MRAATALAVVRRALITIVARLTIGATGDTRWTQRIVSAARIRARFDGAVHVVVAICRNRAVRSRAARTGALIAELVRALVAIIRAASQIDAAGHYRAAVVHIGATQLRIAARATFARNAWADVRLMAAAAAHARIIRASIAVIARRSVGTANNAGRAKVARTAA
jgi:hypothetical protein